MTPKLALSLIALTLAFSLTSCGYSEVGTTGLVQVKRIHKVTPILCPDYFVMDAALGVMQNGAGSMSQQDIDITISEEQATKIEAWINHHQNKKINK